MYGTPLAATDPLRERHARAIVAEDEVGLTSDQQRCVEAAIADVAARYGWTLHAQAATTDHVHAVMGAPRDGEALRDALKAVASRPLNRQFGPRTWWAEGGSAKYLWERDYFDNAVAYVLGQREL